ncbi:MAG: hypothetical protein HOP10_04410 [Chitinophagaceae bacterium]|nr:hypothetical protein [Chitinophagaceae bacterium]
MKKLFFFLLTVITCEAAIAQNVGIGTSTPNASAQLDVVSTNKGLLLPRMTSSNRVLISNPANGLIVYDTTFNRLYQYQDGVWRYLINNTYWVQSSTRNWVYNTGDSVGIGTSIPTQRLDVSGNIRSRDDILADNNITATGNIGAANISTGGNLTAGGILTTGGTTLLIGDVTTNSDLIVNNVAATMQLKSSGVNKGYFQLSGNNVRMGTNSGNSTGNLIIRMNGNDRVTINPAGDIDIDGKITRSSVTGSTPLLPVCIGLLTVGGGITNGTGNFTVTFTSSGSNRQYDITCSQFNSGTVLFISHTDLPPCGIYYTTFVSPNTMRVLYTNCSQSFCFIAYNTN